MSFIGQSAISSDSIISSVRRSNDIRFADVSGGIMIRLSRIFLVAAVTISISSGCSQSPGNSGDDTKAAGDGFTLPPDPNDGIGTSRQPICRRHPVPPELAPWIALLGYDVEALIQDGS